MTETDGSVEKTARFITEQHAEKRAKDEEPLPILNKKVLTAWCPFHGHQLDLTNIFCRERAIFQPVSGPFLQ